MGGLVKSPKNIGQLRHRGEIPLQAVSLVLTVLVLAGALVLMLDPELPLALGLSGSMEEISGLVFFAPLMPLLIFFTRLYTAAIARANGVRVGPDQFPELHRRYHAIAEQLGMSAVPALYVINGNGVVNAYALSCNSRRKYVVIHAEIAHLIDRRPEVVEFVLAHELGHHKLGHVSLFRILLQVIPGFLVLPQRAAIRAQEYSADRVAASVCNGCPQVMGLLAVGPYLEQQVNVEAYDRQAAEEERSWFVRLVHWMSDHAVNTKRLRALRQIEKHGFDAHGALF